MIEEIVDEISEKAEDKVRELLGEDRRVQKFGKFFTAYMGTASLVTAALPIPVRYLHLIPAFASQEKFLNTYTSMSCFLVFAYIFYIRHMLARWMFIKRGTHFGVRFWVSVFPVVCIVCSIVCAIAYHRVLGEALDNLSVAGARLPSSVLLSKIDAREIPGSGRLFVAYLGMFVFAESAFVLMAIREYLQDTLKLEEYELIFGVDPGKLKAGRISREDSR